MKKWLLIIILLIFPSYALAASFTNDWFTSGLGGSWTSSGPGTVTVADGHLKITTSSTTYTYVYQSTISGDFDVVARIKEDYKYPARIDSAQYQVGFYVMINADNIGYSYQNYCGLCVGNEAYLGNTIAAGPPNVYNPEISPLEYYCARLKRVGNEFFYYYNTNSTCDGSWVESGIAVGSKLSSSADVEIGIRARAPLSITWTIDYVTNYGAEETPIVRAITGTTATSGITFK